MTVGGWGMKGVDTIARIRRGFLVQGKAIKEIVRELHVSRNTVRKVLRSGETAFSYARTEQPRPKLGPWRDDLDRLLAANASSEEHTPELQYLMRRQSAGFYMKTKT